MTTARATGAYFTTGNPFNNPPFRDWAMKACLPHLRILEPFAGANHLINTLRDLGFCKTADSFDIAPAADEVQPRDTLTDFPKGWSVCVTNPPWLAKNSATRRGLPFPATHYADLYMVALELCLTHCDYIAALVPESFIQSGLFTKRLRAFISLPPMFEDTDNPVGLALFCPHYQAYTSVWHGDQRIGLLHELKQHCPPPATGLKTTFNAPHGNIGLIGIDNTTEASIRFCDPAELNGYDVKHSSRAITRIAVDGDVSIDKLNAALAKYRADTHDVFLTAFKGIRKDGRYRRRLDFATARAIIHHCR